LYLTAVPLVRESWLGVQLDTTRLSKDITYAGRSMDRSHVEASSESSVAVPPVPPHTVPVAGEEAAACFCSGFFSCLPASCQCAACKSCRCPTCKLCECAACKCNFPSLQCPSCTGSCCAAPQCPSCTGGCPGCKACQLPKCCESPCCTVLSGILFCQCFHTRVGPAPAAAAVAPAAVIPTQRTMTTRRTGRTQKQGAKGYEVRLSTEKEDPAADGELDARLCVGMGVWQGGGARGREAA
jgi:hypothetical protein